MTKKKLTIYDIAKLSNSSASTVSAVLSGQWRKRRIKPETADRIVEVARLHRYTTNLQARGLRKSRSGLIGLMIPTHDDRFFSLIAERFGAKARERGLCPIVVSTLRSPDEEQRAAETLLSYSVDMLFVCGASEPNSISNICRTAGVAQINLDLPGDLAPSVVSDNEWGAERLTAALIERLNASHAGIVLQSSIYFLGGYRNEYATEGRVAGFCKGLREAGHDCIKSQIIPSGYGTEKNKQALVDLTAERGRFPEALFVNSIKSFEGLMAYIQTVPLDEIQDSIIGVFDWDPLIERLPFQVLIVRQDTDSLVDRAFELADLQAGSNDVSNASLVTVRPQLMF